MIKLLRTDILCLLTDTVLVLIFVLVVSSCIYDINFSVSLKKLLVSTV